MGIPIYDIFIVLFNNLDGWSVVLTDSQNKDVDLWCGHSLTQFRYSGLVLIWSNQPVTSHAVEFTCSQRFSSVATWCFFFFVCLSDTCVCCNGYLVLCFSHIVSISVLVCLLLYRMLIISRLGVTSYFPSFSLFFCNQFIIFYSGCVFFPHFLFVSFYVGWWCWYILEKTFKFCCCCREYVLLPAVFMCV